MMTRRVYRAVVIGASAGGVDALLQILTHLPPDYALPVIIVQHLHPRQQGSALIYTFKCCALPVKEAEEKEPVVAGSIYVAPPNYHLLIEDDYTFSLSIDPQVKYTRPSIDVLFESAADAYGAQLVAVILSGANDDGADGLRRIKACGGLVVVQQPSTAEASYMPQAALSAVQSDHILYPSEIGKFLFSLGAAEQMPEAHRVEE